MKKTLEELEMDRMKWSLNQFPQANAISSLRKLCGEPKEGEVYEVYEILNSDYLHEPDFSHLTEEYADCLMCLFDSSGRAGISVSELRDAFEKKLEVNKARKWKLNDDNTYSHIKNENG